LFHNRISQSIDNLLGNSLNPLEFRSDYFDERLFIDKCHESGYAIGISHLNGEKLMIYYIFGDLDKAIESIEVCLKTIDTLVGHFINCIFNFYSALTMIAIDPDGYKKQISTCQKKVGLVAKYAPMNASHKWELIEAERLQKSGKKHLAIELYDRAINGAKVNGFIQEEALANELAAKFYLDWGKEKIAATYMQEAYYCYARWGAKAKTNHLEQLYPQLLTPIIQSQKTEFNPLSTLTTITNSRLINSPSIQSLDTFDLASVIQSAQALSSTIEISQLIEQLVQIILKNSGAQTCILALPTSTSSMVNLDDDEWQIHAIATVNSGSINVDLTSRFLVNNFEYPVNLIYWIKNTKQTAIFNARQKLELEKAGVSSIDDRYLSEHQPRSVFALPIVKQESVIGVLYLEHRHAPDIFTLDKKTIISFLCTQAAIAIDNARLYHNSRLATETIGTKQSYLAALLNNIPHMAWLKDENSRFIAVNQAVGDICGYEPAEMIGKNDLDLWPVEIARKYIDDDLLTMQSGQRKIVQAKILNAQQKERWLETIKTPIRDINGNITGTVGIALDITDRKTAEHKLEFTQFAVDNSADGIALLKPDGSFAYANKSMCRMLGYSSTELGAMYIWDIDDETSPHTWPHHWQKLKATGGFSVETHHQSKNGNRYPVEISLNYFEFGGEEYNFTRTRDVTDSKAAELALRQSQSRYQKLSDNIPGAIYQFRLTPDGSIDYPYISSGCAELFGISSEVIMADSSCLLEKLHPDDVSLFQQIVAESAQNMTSKQWEGRAVMSSGEIKWIRSVSRPERQADGAIVWDGVMLDITDLKQAETNLYQANERLELTNSELQQATRLKDEFLATMSHELRTPLNAILGMSEALQDEVFGSLNSRQINSISTIEKSGEHLLSLINDLLDVSKISAGKLELNITEVSLADLCKSSLVFIKQKAFEKQIQLDTHLPANLDRIFVDERRMRQVLINLLSNAVKFTPNGGAIALFISVKSPAVCHQTEGYSLCFAISDTGIGIASDDIPKLFQPFIQVDSNLNRKYEGTGLGLVLVKQIVELHGGFVSIDSEVGKGSCFSIMLPQTDLKSMSESLDSHPSESIAASSPVDAPIAPLILLAEDNELNVNTFSSYLIAKGYRTIVANNGREAIALYQSQQPDLILMDVQMPDLDGIAAIEYIRQQSTQIRPPIIAITALAMAGDREKCLAAGANKYITKPLKLRELYQAIQECLDFN
jgi:PAS domain S-box-containing protein